MKVRKSDGDGKNNKTIDPVPEIRKYGEGEWFWMKSCEFYNPDSPFASLSCAQLALYDAMTFIAFAGQNWKIRAAAGYLSQALHGRIKKRNIWYCMKVLIERDFVRLLERNVKRGNLYLVNPILMRKAQAERIANYDLTLHMIVKSKTAKTKEKKERRALSRSEQLELAIKERAREASIGT